LPVGGVPCSGAGESLAVDVVDVSGCWSEVVGEGSVLGALAERVLSEVRLRCCDPSGIGVCARLTGPGRLSGDAAFLARLASGAAVGASASGAEAVRSSGHGASPGRAIG